MTDATGPRQFVVFTLAKEQYALPIDQVQEIVRYTKPRSVAASDHYVRGVLNLRGKILPIYDLAARLGTGSELTDHSRIVIIDTGSETIGLIVDRVEEVLTIEESQIEQPPSADSTLVEAIAKVDQQLVVLLNPNSFLGVGALAA